jgi:antitoxin HigA-1
MPTNRAPTHPGAILAEEFLGAFQMSQVDLAARIGVPFQRVNQIVRGKRAITPDTALRLSQLFGTTPEFWLNLQQARDLYEALHSGPARRIRSIKPLRSSAA